jgi:hypothetical protein
LIKDNEFTGLCLFIDSREQTNAKDGKTRVKRVMDWFISHGGSIDMIEIRALPLCDIAICGGFDTETKTFLPGLFRDKEVCVAIEYKTMQDYSGSYSDLDWKLVDSYLHYKQVALFVEHGDMELSYSNGQSFVRNKSVPNGTADILPYEHYLNECDRYSRIAEVHVRTFPYENFIDANLDSLMTMISGEPKVPMYCRGKDLDQEKVAFINSLLYIPKIGVSTAMKFTNYYPNWETLAEHASYAGEYEAIAGILTGKRVRDFVQMGREKNKKICSRVNECFENRKSLKIVASESHEEKYIPMDKEQKSMVANAIYDYLMSFYPEGKTPLEICEHFDCQDEHIKDMLVCLKRMAENGRITSTIKGIFVAVPKNSSYPQDTILTEPQRHLIPCGNTSGEIPDVQIINPDRCCVACTDEDDRNSIKLVNGICPICGQDYSVSKVSPMTPRIEGYTEPNEDVSKSSDGKEVGLPEIHDSSGESKDSVTFTSLNNTNPLIQVKDSRNSTGRSETVLMNPDNTSVGVIPDTPSIAQKALDTSNLDTSVLPSPQLYTISTLNSCGDKVGEITPSSTTFNHKPVIHTLDDVIVDFCYEKPKADFSIISYCQSKGHLLPEIHKALSGLSKTKLHRYKEKGLDMYSYKGLKATPEYDIITGEEIK